MKKGEIRMLNDTQISEILAKAMEKLKAALL